MDALCKWMGLVEAVNYTRKLGWFKEVGNPKELRFIANKKEWNPVMNPEHFTALLEVAIKKKAGISVVKIINPGSKFYNIQATITLDDVITIELGQTPQQAIVNALLKHVNNKAVVELDN